MARNDAGLEGFGFIFHLWATVLNTYYWARDDFVNIDEIPVCVPHGRM